MADETQPAPAPAPAPKDGLAAQWKSFSSERRMRLLGKMSPEQKHKLRATLEAKPAAATPAPTGVPKDFLSRAGERIKSNVYDPIQKIVKGTAPGGDISSTISHPVAAATRPSPEGDKALHPFGTSAIGNVAAAVTAGPRTAYHAIAPAVQSWWKDPANLVGDVVSIGVGHYMGAGEGTDTVAKPKPEPRLAPAPEQAHYAPPEGIDPKDWSSHIDKVNKAYHEHLQDIGEYANKEARNRAKWVTKAHNAKQSVADQVAATGKRQVLARASEEYSDLAHQNIKRTHQTVRDRLDSRWNSFRENMAGATVSAVETGKIINEARARLRGSPADLKQFNDLIKETGIEVNDEGEITVKEGKPTELPVDTARVHSSAIGDKLAAGDLPGQVYQALKLAKEGVEGQIETAADSLGQGKLYRALKKDWHQYMQDWHNMRSVSGGKGSVLARMLRVPADIKLYRPIIQGSGGNLLREVLGKYRDAGANPELLTNAQKLARQAKEVPVPKVREMPPGYEPSPPPKLKEVAPPKPGEVKSVTGAPKWAKATGRIAGKVVGAGAGSVLGHPFLGMAAGGEAGGAIVDSIYEGRGAKNTPVTVPPGMRTPARFQTHSPVPVVTNLSAAEAADVAKLNRMRSSVPPAILGPDRLAADVGEWQPDPRLGVTSAPDYGQAARSDVERRMGGALKRGQVERRDPDSFDYLLNKREQE